MALINCEIELDLTWSKKYVMSEISVGGDNSVDAALKTGAIFPIKSA